MKNLFSINKTGDKRADEFDETPYLSARVSEEVRTKMKNAFSVVEDEYTAHEPTEEEKQLKKQGNRFLLLSAVCMIGGISLFFIGTRAGWYEMTPFLHILDVGLVAAALFFNLKSKKATNRLRSVSESNVTMDFTEASKLLEEAAAEAARELGIPKNALSVDVLPFHYIMKKNDYTRDDAPVPAGKKNRFDNLSVSLFVKGDHLCLATARELYRIPLSDVRGYRTYDEDYAVEMWLKPEDSDSDKYQAYNIRKNGFLGRKAHGYMGLDIAGEYEILIPGYDFEQVKELLKVSPLSDS